MPFTAVLCTLALATTQLGYRQDNGIAYGTDSDRQKLDIYVPVGKPQFATVIWFHGGGLTGGDRHLTAGFREKGIAVVSASYRLSPTAKAPAYIEDAASAVAWTIKNIEKYGGSPNRVFVSGHSAGGYLAMMVGLDKKWLAPHELDPDRLAGLAPLSGQCITHFTVRSERGLADTKVVTDELAPLNHVRKDAPPMLLVTGDRERELLGRYEENAYLWRMMKVAGHERTELMELDGYDHGGMATPAIPLVLDFIRRVSPDPK